jgi:uncharacterized protein
MDDLDDTLTAVYRRQLPALRDLTPAQVNARDQDGRTPLMHAVLAVDADPRIVELLIERGADVNAADSHGWTALHFAAQDHDVPVARALLAAGADADPVEVTGTTPLWRSVMRSGEDPSVIRDLVQRGADPHRKNRSGVSPIELARSIGYQDAVDLFEGRG